MPCQDDLPDNELFRDACSGITPIPQDQADLDTRPRYRRDPSLKARRRAALEHRREELDALSDRPVTAVEPEQYLEFQRAGLQHVKMRRLRQGGYPIEYLLDLHGYNIQDARALLHEFIRFSSERGFQCVAVIHGKAHRYHQDRPILKSHVNSWLPDLHQVMAFCSAQPKDGGRGAVYVLLKR